MSALSNISRNGTVPQSTAFEEKPKNITVLRSQNGRYRGCDSMGQSNGRRREGEPRAGPNQFVHSVQI